MTPEELRNLIEGDAQAKAYFDSGNDSACAVRCGEIAPPVLVELKLSEIGIMLIYANDPMAGETVLQTFEAVAAGGSPIVKRLLRFMGPEVTPEKHPDFSLAPIRSALTTPVQSGGLGLTTEQAAPILRAAERQPTVTHLDIAAARNLEA